MKRSWIRRTDELDLMNRNRRFGDLTWIKYSLWCAGQSSNDSTAVPTSRMKWAKKKGFLSSGSTISHSWHVTSLLPLTLRTFE